MEDKNRNKEQQQQIESMVESSLIIWIIMLNVHDLNAPIKRQKSGGKMAARYVGAESTSPWALVKRLADLKNRANSQLYSSIYEDQRPKILEDIAKSDGKKSA